MFRRLVSVAPRTGRPVLTFAQLAELAQLKRDIEKMRAFNARADELHKFVVESTDRLRALLDERRDRELAALRKDVRVLQEEVALLRINHSSTVPCASDTE